MNTINTIVENFKLEESWLDFINKYKKTRIKNQAYDKKYKNKQVDSIVSQEDIWPFIISAFYYTFNFPLLILTATPERTRELSRELKSLNKNEDIIIYPGIGNAIYGTNREVAHEVIFWRLKVFRKLSEYRKKGKSEPFIVIATANAIIDLLSKEIANQSDMIKVVSKEILDWENILGKMAEMGYERVNRVFDRGEFSSRGDIINIFDFSMENPVRIEMFGDKIDRIATYNIKDNKTIKNLDSISIFPNIKFPSIKEDRRGMISLIDFFGAKIGDFGLVICDPLEFKLKLKSDVDIILKSAEINGNNKNNYIGDIRKTEQNNKNIIISPELISEDNLKKYNFNLNLMSTFFGDYTKDKTGFFILKDIKKQKKIMGDSKLFLNNIKKDINKKLSVIFINSHYRIKKITNMLLNSNISFEIHPDSRNIKFKDLKQDIVHIFDDKLYSGYESHQLSIYGELDIFEQFDLPAEKEAPLTGVSGGEFKPGDFVVHRTHGIGRYRSIVSEQSNGNKKEYFLIEYADKDLLFVPNWQSDRIHPYIGDKKPVITALNSKQWSNLKKRVRKSVKRVAVDLAKLYAQRSTAKGFAFSGDDLWQEEMEDLFPFSETRGQKKAIDKVKELMKIEKPMDLLVCGDVGFGKTEVAIRAAFKVITSGKQVLMLVPTTILADQHFKTFRQRYDNFPVNVEVISRFKTQKEQKEILGSFYDGKIDLLIGTHRLLSGDIKPKDLGLIIIDEEQRFGVNAKEKIKLLKKEVDVLTLSATPIPRTLYMSLTGIRDIVLIETHPSGRFPIETFVGERNDFVIKIAIEREIKRGGQIYYVYNRIRDIYEKKNKLKILLPGVKIAMTHGRMEGKKIEKIMEDFLNKKYDLLLTTAIIESGMDISNVNTLIVENAQKFGLSQLYQLRGRVGRSSEKAYAYFFYPYRKNLNLVAFQRLKTLSEYTELGSGYDVAMKDLQIRGAGDILGARQHGHINSVGFDMYCQIIKEEVQRLKGIPVEEDINIQIDLPVSAYIPKNYIHNERERINVYRSLANLNDHIEIKNIVSSLKDRYGAIPPVTENLINIARIKLLAKKANVEKIVFLKKKGIILKKIDLNQKKEKLLKASGFDFNYSSRSGEVLLKNHKKQNDIDLVLEFLSDIISFI